MPATRHFYRRKMFTVIMLYFMAAHLYSYGWNGIVPQWYTEYWKQRFEGMGPNELNSYMELVIRILKTLFCMYVLGMSVVCCIVLKTYHFLKQEIQQTSNGNAKNGTNINIQLVTNTQFN
ncbi:hypothetical protein Ddc_13343 [Ditylenchus destructor]|nr:hypothetical protein Ddc_13343 [Ditylenchus destructor]